MTTANLPARAHGLQLPHGTGRVGQGTEIEKSRAASEVYYRVLVAKQMPRDPAAARAAMQTACRNPRLAERAFYSVPKGGSRAEGPSVHLARELARIWGNLDYGVHELRRDDEYGQSELQAFAWDLETNARSASIFIQPHKRDKGKTTEALTSVQDVYESNANAGARRVREAIFAILPAEFVDEAQDICRATLAAGDGKELEQRRRDALHGYKTTFSVTEQQLVNRVGRPVSEWDEQDLASLKVLYRSLQRREVQLDVEFPPAEAVVTPEDIAKGAQRARSAKATATKPAPAAAPEPEPAPGDGEDRTDEYLAAMDDEDTGSGS